MNHPKPKKSFYQEQLDKQEAEGGLGAEAAKKYRSTKNIKWYGKPPKTKGEGCWKKTNNMFGA